MLNARLCAAVMVEVKGLLKTSIDVKMKERVQDDDSCARSFCLNHKDQVAHKSYDSEYKHTDFKS